MGYIIMLTQSISSFWLTLSKSIISQTCAKLNQVFNFSFHGGYCLPYLCIQLQLKMCKRPPEVHISQENHHLCSLFLLKLLLILIVIYCGQCLIGGWSDIKWRVSLSSNFHVGLTLWFWRRKYLSSVLAFAIDCSFRWCPPFTFPESPDIFSNYPLHAHCVVSVNWNAPTLFLITNWSESAAQR